MTPTYDPTDREDRREEAARDTQMHPRLHDLYDLLDNFLRASTTTPPGFTPHRKGFWQTKGSESAAEALLRFWQEHRR